MSSSPFRLYSYCVRYDAGSAPNPYWGKCTLVICKPAIRRTAEIGDWIVGLGSANSPIGDGSHDVVYAMKVTQKMTMEAYDDFCGRHLPNKIPSWNSNRYSRRMGDCIYDYSRGLPPKLRQSVHDERNRETDLSGENALLSEHFYYFGNQPIRLPEELETLVHPAQGHKSNANQPFAAAFAAWINGLGYETNKMHGEPQLKLKLRDDPECRSKCASQDLEEDNRDALAC